MTVMMTKPTLRVGKMHDPWDSILRPLHPDFESQKRADPQHPLDFFRGKDFSDRYVFSIEGAITIDLIPRVPPLSGISCGIHEQPSKRCRLVLTLMADDQKDIFRALCTNLMDATVGLPRKDDKNGIITVANLIRRWHEMLRRRESMQLSYQQIIGLVGELFFLRNRVLPRLSPFDAVASWRGPYGDEQDFVFGRKIAEIKTQISSADRKVRVSSEHQLDTRLHEIVLVHQTISPVDREVSEARTLNQLVEELVTTFNLSASSASELFLSGLIEVGWKNSEPYDEISWIYSSTSYFHVRHGFPRVTPPDLVMGIDRVAYDLQLDACSGFSLNELEMAGVLFNGP